MQPATHWLSITFRVSAAGGEVMVMDADLELMANPEAAMSRFCAFAGVEFDPGMLSWTPEVRV